MKKHNIIMEPNNCLIIAIVIILLSMAISVQAECLNLILEWNNVTEEYAESGIYVSKPLLYDKYDKYMCYVNWNENVPAGTNLTVRLRSGNTTNLTGDFVGPDMSASSYYTNPPAYINESMLDDDYIQWKAELNTTDTSITPAMDDVEIACYSRCDMNDSRECRQGYTCSEEGFCEIAPQGCYTKYYTFDDFFTSDFNNAQDPENMTDVMLVGQYGSIIFPGNHSINASCEDYDANIIVGDCFISVNASSLHSSFNATAQLVLDNADGHCGEDAIFTSDSFRYSADAIRDEDAECESCNATTYFNNHMIGFNIPHFSSYAIGTGDRLDIYDEYEGSQVNTSVSIDFYANYTNSTSEEHISGATCLIEFDDAPGSWNPMTDNGDNYNYTKSSGFAAAGTHDWSVNCTHPSFYPLNTTDDVSVASTGEPEEAVPEFSLVTLLLAMMITLMAMKLIRKK